jgi:hypothetical protein
VIEKLTLKNFQAHKHLCLEFDPHVTTIVGPSDAGKSAAVRAISFVALNNLPGDSFVREGADSASCSLRVDGQTVSRVRGKKGNLYKLDGKAYKAFRSDVPEAIAQVLNLSDINFQFQLDPPFWFGESAGQVSKNLNQIVNLGKIDSTLAHVASEVRRAKTLVEVTEDRLKAAHARLNDLGWVEEFDQDLRRLERARKEYLEVRSRTLSVGRAVRRGHSAVRALGTLSRAARDARRAAKAGRRAAAAAARADDLLELVGSAKELDRLSQVEVPSIRKWAAAKEESDAVAEKARVLDGLLSELALQKETCDYLETQHLMVTERLKKAEKGRKKCPTCGRPM